jgi:hypothetical protein
MAGGAAEAADGTTVPATTVARTTVVVPATSPAPAVPSERLLPRRRPPSPLRLPPRQLLLSHPRLLKKPHSTPRAAATLKLPVAVIVGAVAPAAAAIVGAVAPAVVAVAAVVATVDTDTTELVAAAVATTVPATTVGEFHHCLPPSRRHPTELG